uniref:Uncharacterized protein n=1 Tax=Anas platyrhynchos TaxID=8839 RepID=A0A8B9SXL3_ANAPL
MGWDGMGWDGMGWDGMGWDGMSVLHSPRDPQLCRFGTPSLSTSAYGPSGWSQDPTPATGNPRHSGLWLLPCRQHKLEEDLLFSGKFTDALQALMDWLYRAEPQLSEDVPVGGDRDLVSDLMDKHKVGVLGRAGGCLLRPGPVGPLGSDSPRAALGSAPALPAAPCHAEQCWGAPRAPRTPRTVHLGHLQSHWDPRQLPLPPALSPSGLPEGAGQASQLHQDAEALGAGPDPRQQQRGLPVAAEADGGAEHAVGPGLQAVCLQAGPAGGCAPAGRGVSHPGAVLPGAPLRVRENPQVRRLPRGGGGCAGVPEPAAGADSRAPPWEEDPGSVPALAGPGAGVCRAQQG